MLTCSFRGTGTWQPLLLTVPGLQVQRDRQGSITGNCSFATCANQTSNKSNKQNKLNKNVCFPVLGEAAAKVVPAKLPFSTSSRPVPCALMYPPDGGPLPDLLRAELPTWQQGRQLPQKCLDGGCRGSGDCSQAGAKGEATLAEKVAVLRNTQKHLETRLVCLSLSIITKGLGALMQQDKHCRRLRCCKTAGT